MNGLDVAEVDSEDIIYNLQNRGDCIGGAGSRSNDSLVGGYLVVVDSINNVWQLALTRCRELNLGGALALQVLRQSLLITPTTGVIDDQGAVDAIGGVVDGGWTVGVDHTNWYSVSDYRVIVLVNRDGALERSMHRISAK